MKTQLPAGLVDGNIEVFVHNGQTRFLVDGKVQNEVPVAAKQAILKDMMANKPATALLMSWGFYGEELLKKYAGCRFGGFDNVPDVEVENGNLHAEYWDCPRKNICTGCGIICALPKGPNGCFTSRELDAIRAIQDGSPMKAACQKLNIKFHTFRDRMKKAYQKAGVHSNVELLNYAYSNNII